MPQSYCTVLLMYGVLSIGISVHSSVGSSSTPCPPTSSHTTPPAHVRDGTYTLRNEKARRRSGGAKHCRYACLGDCPSMLRHLHGAQFAYVLPTAPLLLGGSGAGYVSTAGSPCVEWHVAWRTCGSGVASAHDVPLDQPRAGPTDHAGECAAAAAAAAAHVSSAPDASFSETTPRRSSWSAALGSSSCAAGADISASPAAARIAAATRPNGEVAAAGVRGIGDSSCRQTEGGEIATDGRPLRFTGMALARHGMALARHGTGPAWHGTGPTDRRGRNRNSRSAAVQWTTVHGAGRVGPSRWRGMTAPAMATWPLQRSACWVCQRCRASPRAPLLQRRKRLG
jgi:hypothetical protein